MKAEKEEIAGGAVCHTSVFEIGAGTFIQSLCTVGVCHAEKREWIRNNKELYDAMYSGGEGKNDHAYSARQVRLIVRYLDEP